MLQILIFTITAIVLYVFSDWLLGKLEEFRGKPFPNRSIIFFVIILILSVSVFEGFQRFFASVPTPS